MADNNDNQANFSLNLIKSFSWFWKFLAYLLLPFATLATLVLQRPEDNFGAKLIYSFGLVYVLGGFFVVSTKAWEFWDDRFLDFMKNRWKASSVMKKVFYKVVIPKDFKHGAGDMIGFFYNIHPMNGGIRSMFERYTSGKDYYDFTFDFIIRGGKVEMYICFNFKRQDMIFKAINNRYPEIKLVQTQDPYKNWPKTWEEGIGVPGYKDFHAHDYGFADSDIYPLANAGSFGDNGSPLTDLLESFKNYDPKATIILQYIVRSFPGIHYDRWISELSDIRASMFERSTKFTVKDDGATRTATTGDLITEKQKNNVNSLEERISDAQYRVHLRFMVFYPDNKNYYGPIMEKFMKIYSGATSAQNMIAKDWYTATDRTFLNSKLPFLDGIIGPFMDRFYHVKENIYRRKMHYFGLLNRKLDVTHPSSNFMLDVPSLAALVHFPQNIGIFEEYLVEPKPTNSPELEKTENDLNKPVNSFEKLQNLREKMTSDNTKQTVI